MKTIHKCLLMLGGMSLSLLLTKPASAQNNNKPGVRTKESRKVHIRIDDDKDGHVRKIDTTFEVGPDFDMQAWMKSMDIDMPEGESDVMLMIPPQPPVPPVPPTPGELPGFEIEGDHPEIVIKEFSGEGLTPPCEPMDKDCMLKWLGSDSTRVILKGTQPIHPEESRNIVIFHDKDGKCKETKMVFSRIVVKKIEIKTDNKEGKEVKSLNAHVYPNPNNGVFNIDIAVPGKAPASFEITDKDGKVIYNEEVSSSGKREVDLTSQGKGTFFLNLKQGKKTIQRQIMVN